MEKSLVRAQLAGTVLGEVESQIVLQVQENNSVIYIPVTVPTTTVLYIREYVANPQVRPELVDSWISTMDGFGISVRNNRTVINKLENGIYHSEICLVQQAGEYQTELTVDCKTSVALLFAVAMQKRERDCDLYVDQSVVDQVKETASKFRGSKEEIDALSDAFGTLLGKDPEEESE